MNKVWKISKKLLTSVSGLCLLMLLAAFLVSSLGTLLSGGIQQWQATLKSAASYLFIWRLFIYGLIGYFWWLTVKNYKQKDHKTGLEKMYKLGGLALLVIISVEVPKLWGLFNVN